MGDYVYLYDNVIKKTSIPTTFAMIGGLLSGALFSPVGKEKILGTYIAEKDESSCFWMMLLWIWKSAIHK